MTETEMTDQARAIAETVARWRAKLSENGKPISQRALARRMTDALFPHDSITYATIQNWECGRARPSYWQMVGLMRQGGALGQMALDVLRALRPDVWGAEAQ